MLQRVHRLHLRLHLVPVALVDAADGQELDGEALAPLVDSRETAAADGVVKLVLVHGSFTRGQTPSSVLHLRAGVATAAKMAGLAQC